MLADPEGRINAPLSQISPAVRGAWKSVNGGPAYAPATNVHLEKRQALILVPATP